MEKKKELIEITKQIILKGEEKLLSAEILLENNLIDDSISRAYYAAFLIARGLLNLMGDTPKSHGGVITMFGLKVVKEGLLSSEIGHALNELYKARELGDYAVISFYTKQDGQKYLEQAKSIIKSIKNLIIDKFKIEL